MASIMMIENVLTQALDTSQSLTPPQLCDLMEMFITDLHLRKVTGDPWTTMAPMCVGGIELATRIDVEMSLLKIGDLSEQTAKTMTDAIQLSQREIKALRGKLLEHLALLKQCPLPGVTIH